MPIILVYFNFYNPAVASSQWVIKLPPCVHSHRQSCNEHFWGPGVPGIYSGEEGVHFCRLCWGKPREDIQKRCGSGAQEGDCVWPVDICRASVGLPLLWWNIWVFFFSFFFENYLSWLGASCLGLFDQDGLPIPLTGLVTLSREFDSGKEEK